MAGSGSIPRRKLGNQGLEMTASGFRRDSGGKGYWRDLGIGIVPSTPLGRGFFSGKPLWRKSTKTTVDSSCFQGSKEKNLEKNKVLYDRVAALAKNHGCTPDQLALAWLLSPGDNVVPIPGTTKILNLEQNLGSSDVKLDSQSGTELRIFGCEA